MPQRKTEEEKEVEVDERAGVENEFEEAAYWATVKIVN